MLNKKKHYVVDYIEKSLSYLAKKMLCCWVLDEDKTIFYNKKREIYYIKEKLIKKKYESLLTPMGLMHILHNMMMLGLIKTNVINIKKKNSC